MFRPRFVAIGLLALVLLILVIQNSEVVTLTILFWDIELSRVVLILVTATIGFAGGYLVARLMSRRSASR